MSVCNKYTYCVTWSEEDHEFVGLCAEFPGVSWLEEEKEAAFHGICALVTDIIEDMKTTGEFNNDHEFEEVHEKA